MIGVDAADPMIGRRFGGAVVIRKIGAGGMGAVYEAENRLLGKRYAVKVVLPELAGSASAAERFFQEARAAAAVDHPRIVPIIDCGYTDDGRPFQVMPFLSGQDLTGYCARWGQGGRLPLAHAAPLFFQILDGLAAAHDRRIVHRDLKGANIHVLDDRTIKILDFGIAKLLDPSMEGMVRTGSFQIVGTPGYMAPEQARGGPIDCRADLWALGAVFYRVLTGRLPFEGSDPIELVARAMLTPAPTASDLVPEIPPSVSEILRSCMAPDPDRRPESARTLATWLMAAIPDGRAIANRAAPALVLRSGPGDLTIQRDPGPEPSKAPSSAAGLTRAGETLSFFAGSVRRIGRWTALVALAVAALVAAAALTPLRPDDPVGLAPVAAREPDRPAPAVPSAPPEAAPAPTAPAARPSRRAPVEQGTLIVTADPWADVWIDGQHAESTPVMRQLAVGRHKVVLRRPTGGVETVHVTIRKGRTTRVERDWSNLR
jgi:eukaryotic-like serine/threonine-protein kinase